VILLDTHLWVWWVLDLARLAPAHRRAIARNEAAGLGVSIIACWEVALLEARGRLELPVPLETWLATALAYPGIRLLDLTPRIAVEATRLPDHFHRDPADQIIVATARVYDCPLVTADRRVLDTPTSRPSRPDARQPGELPGRSRSWTLTIGMRSSSGAGPNNRTHPMPILFAGS
jgi:PIN domain nuclease of toxin-antitoxin system